MARRVPTAIKEDATNDASGGAPGIIPEALAAPVQKPSASLSRAPVDEAPATKPERFEVTKGGQVMYAGAKTEIRAGKVLDTATHDVDLLRGQGIELRSLG